MKNKQKNADKKNAAITRLTAFNPYYIVWLLGFAFSLWGNIYLFLEEDKISWILILFLVVFIIALLADAVYYIFTKQEVYLVHFGGYKWRLPWFCVRSITKHNFWDSFSFQKLMGYEIYYDKPYKGRQIRNSLILALTPTVKKCLNKFYYGEITFETKRRKSKK